VGGIVRHLLDELEPSIRRAGLEANVDLAMLDIITTPMEVAPTAHYSMGGVWVRPEDHGTDDH
jgi:succinate dehydrogenase/fumarate reductase flavoprotein subunit